MRQHERARIIDILAARPVELVQLRSSASPMSRSSAHAPNRSGRTVRRNRSPGDAGRASTRISFSPPRHTARSGGARCADRRHFGRRLRQRSRLPGSRPDAPDNAVGTRRPAPGSRSSRPPGQPDHLASSAAGSGTVTSTGRAYTRSKEPAGSPVSRASAATISTPGSWRLRRTAGPSRRAPGRHPGPPRARPARPARPAARGCRSARSRYRSRFGPAQGPPGRAAPRCRRSSSDWRRSRALSAGSRPGA